MHTKVHIMHPWGQWPASSAGSAISINDTLSLDQFGPLCNLSFVFQTRSTPASEEEYQGDRNADSQAARAPHDQRLRRRRATSNPFIHP